MNARRRHRRRAGTAGIILLEILLAVSIFALGVLALGRCVHACLDAQRLRAEDARARQLLENRQAELAASPALPDPQRKRTLSTGVFSGMTLVETRRALDLRGEQDTTLNGLYEITLRAEWPTSGGGTGNRTCSFYLLRVGS